MGDVPRGPVVVRGCVVGTGRRRVEARWLRHSAGSKPPPLPWPPGTAGFQLVPAVLVWVVSPFKLQLTINSSQEVFFQDLAVKVHGTESFFLLPLVFGVVTLLFTLLGQNLGRLLAAVRPPLTAYTIDVAGSIAGSALFALVSFLGAPPGVWFGLPALGVLALPQRGGLLRVLNAAILLGVVVGVSVLGRSSSWSPYYRIDVQP